MSKDLHVKNISLEATEEDLRKLFSLFGRIDHIHLITDAKTGKFVGAGYVVMKTEAEAREARIGADGTRLGNRIIAVSEARPREPKTGRQSDDGRRPARERRPGGKKR